MRAIGFPFTVSVLITLLYVRLPFQVLIIFWLGNYIKSKLNSFLSFYSYLQISVFFSSRVNFSMLTRKTLVRKA